MFELLLSPVGAAPNGANTPAVWGPNNVDIPKGINGLIMGNPIGVIPVMFIMNGLIQGNPNVEAPTLSSVRSMTLLLRLSWLLPRPLPACACLPRPPPPRFRPRGGITFTLP